MNKPEIIIVGAGACGLVAARELVKAGYKVIVLEARDRIGGRIYTFKGNNFTLPIEAGAEFIHGDLPLTQAILKEANVKFYLKEGETYRLENDEVKKTEEFIEDFASIMEKMKNLKEDMPVQTFIDLHLNDKKFESARASMTRFVEGYDAADTNRVSTFALRDEWSSGGTSIPYLVKGGYGQLTDFLLNEINNSGAIIHRSTIVKEIHWEKDNAKIFCENGKQFEANKVIVTVPLGVLQAGSEDRGHIRFYPGIDEQLQAAQVIGFGSVIKILIEFKKAFWLDNLADISARRNIPEPGFLISDAAIPVWWSQLPDERPLLTGWLGGPITERYDKYREEEILEKAMDSLAYIFNIPVSKLEEQVIARKVFNWKSDPFALGAYAYETLQSSEARKMLNQPLENTLFFAGEALYEGDSMGTVEAALASGLEVVKKVLILKEMIK